MPGHRCRKHTCCKNHCDKKKSCTKKSPASNHDFNQIYLLDPGNQGNNGGVRMIPQEFLQNQVLPVTNVQNVPFLTRPLTQGPNLGYATGPAAGLLLPPGGTLRECPYQTFVPIGAQQTQSGPGTQSPPFNVQVEGIRALGIPVCFLGDENHKVGPTKSKTTQPTGSNTHMERMRESTSRFPSPRRESRRNKPKRTREWPSPRSNTRRHNEIMLERNPQYFRLYERRPTRESNTSSEDDSMSSENCYMNAVNYVEKEWARPYQTRTPDVYQMRRIGNSRKQSDPTRSASKKSSVDEVPEREVQPSVNAEITDELRRQSIDTQKRIDDLEKKINEIKECICPQRESTIHSINDKETQTHSNTLSVEHIALIPADHFKPCKCQSDDSPTKSTHMKSKSKPKALQRTSKSKKLPRKVCCVPQVSEDDDEVCPEYIECPKSVCRCGGSDSSIGDDSSVSIYYVQTIQNTFQKFKHNSFMPFFKEEFNQSAQPNFANTFGSFLQPNCKSTKCDGEKFLSSDNPISTDIIHILNRGYHSFFISNIRNNISKLTKDESTIKNYLSKYDNCHLCSLNSNKNDQEVFTRADTWHKIYIDFKYNYLKASARRNKIKEDYFKRRKINMPSQINTQGKVANIRQVCAILKRMTRIPIRRLNKFSCRKPIIFMHRKIYWGRKNFRKYCLQLLNIFNRIEEQEYKELSLMNSRTTETIQSFFNDSLLFNGVFKMYVSNNIFDVGCKRRNENGNEFPTESNFLVGRNRPLIEEDAKPRVLTNGRMLSARKKSRCDCNTEFRPSSDAFVYSVPNSDLFSQIKVGYKNSSTILRRDSSSDYSSPSLGEPSTPQRYHYIYNHEEDHEGGRCPNGVCRQERSTNPGCKCPYIKECRCPASFERIQACQCSRNSVPSRHRNKGTQNRGLPTRGESRVSRPVQMEPESAEMQTQCERESMYVKKIGSDGVTRWTCIPLESTSTSRGNYTVPNRSNPYMAQFGRGSFRTIDSGDPHYRENSTFTEPLSTRHKDIQASQWNPEEIQQTQCDRESMYVEKIGCDGVTRWICRPLDIAPEIPTSRGTYPVPNKGSAYKTEFGTKHPLIDEPYYMEKSTFTRSYSTQHKDVQAPDRSHRQTQQFPTIERDIGTATDRPRTTHKDIQASQLNPDGVQQTTGNECLLRCEACHNLLALNSAEKNFDIVCKNCTNSPRLSRKDKLIGTSFNNDVYCDKCKEAIEHLQHRISNSFLQFKPKADCSDCKEYNDYWVCKNCKDIPTNSTKSGVSFSTKTNEETVPQKSMLSEKETKISNEPHRTSIFARSSKRPSRVSKRSLEKDERQISSGKETSRQTSDQRDSKEYVIIKKTSSEERKTRTPTQGSVRETRSSKKKSEEYEYEDDPSGVRKSSKAEEEILEERTIVSESSESLIDTRSRAGSTKRTSGPKNEHREYSVNMVSPLCGHTSSAFTYHRNLGEANQREECKAYKQQISSMESENLTARSDIKNIHKTLNNCNEIIIAESGNSYKLDKSNNEFLRGREESRKPRSNQDNNNNNNIRTFFKRWHTKKQPVPKSTSKKHMKRDNLYYRGIIVTRNGSLPKGDYVLQNLSVTDQNALQHSDNGVHKSNKTAKDEEYHSQTRIEKFSITKRNQPQNAHQKGDKQLRNGVESREKKRRTSPANNDLFFTENDSNSLVSKLSNKSGDEIDTSTLTSKKKGRYCLKKIRLPNQSRSIYVLMKRKKNS